MIGQKFANSQLKITKISVGIDGQIKLEIRETVETGFDYPHDKIDFFDLSLYLGYRDLSNLPNSLEGYRKTFESLWDLTDAMYEKEI